MISSPYSAEDWPIAAAMLPFGNKDSHGGAIHDAEPDEWAKHLRLVRHMGFTEVDPTDTWGSGWRSQSGAARRLQECA